MEIEEFMRRSFGDFKTDAVREIFSESVGVEFNTQSPPSTALPSASISELTQNLMLSSASSINDRVLDTLKITCVVNVAPELPDPPLPRTDIVYHKIPILDSKNSKIHLYFDEAADLIHEVCTSGGKTLVYCVAGISRSASICLAYLMKYKRLTLLDSYNYIKLRRSRVKPNCSFFRQLIDYEKNMFGTNSVRMIFNELVQMEIPEVYDRDYRYFKHFTKK